MAKRISKGTCSISLRSYLDYTFSVSDVTMVPWCCKNIKSYLQRDAPCATTIMNSDDAPASMSMPGHLCRWRNNDAPGEQITARSLQTKRRVDSPRVIEFMLFWQNKRRTWKEPRRGVLWSLRLKSGHAPLGHEAVRVCLGASVLP